jgi:hypothetical protein
MLSLRGALRRSHLLQTLRLLRFARNDMLLRFARNDILLRFALPTEHTDFL